jgi:hypothetical protein
MGRAHSTALRFAGTSRLLDDTCGSHEEDRQCPSSSMCICPTIAAPRRRCGEEMSDQKPGVLGFALSVALLGGVYF